jgi:DNA-binding NarL/FixJ family response regulator
LSKQNTNIALVDDHVLLRNGLANLVNTFDGYSVLFEADNGKDFIKQLEKFPSPDIILLDITMPEMNGPETASWIQKNLPTSKVLVLSVMDSEVMIINMLKRGAKGYILKDSKPAVFKQALDNIRDSGFFMNDLVSNKMVNYLTHVETTGGKESKGLASVTGREMEFLKLAATDLTMKEIADKMNVSSRTVDGYRDELFKKLNVQSRIGLVLFAIKNGIHKL